MLGLELVGNDDATLNKLTVIKLLPFFRHIECNAKIVVAVFLRSRQSGGYLRFREKTDRRFVCRKLRCKLCVFGKILNFNVSCGINAVFLQKVLENVLGSCALTGRIDLLALEVGKAVDRVAVFKDMENAEGIDSREADIHVGLIEKNCRQVNGNCRNVDLTADYSRSDFFGSSREAECIFILCGAVLVIFHKLNHAHTRGALERHHTNRYVFTAIVVIHVAGNEREYHQRRQQQSQNFLHVVKPSFFNFFVFRLSFTPDFSVREALC